MRYINILENLARRLSRSLGSPSRTLRSRRTRGDCDSESISIPRGDVVLVVWLVATRAAIIEAVPPGPVTVLLPGEKSVPEHRQTRQRNGFLANWIVTVCAYLRCQPPSIIGHKRHLRVAPGLPDLDRSVFFVKLPIVVGKSCRGPRGPSMSLTACKPPMTLLYSNIFKNFMGILFINFDISLTLLRVNYRVYNVIHSLKR